jgi:hypothetical protein
MVEGFYMTEQPVATFVPPIQIAGSDRRRSASWRPAAS